MGKDFRPDYVFELTVASTNGASSKKYFFYLDAKYRSYSEQGVDEWIGDIKGVAVDKYIDGFRGMPHEAKASFIVHTDNDSMYCYYGGHKESRLEGKIAQAYLSSPRHKLGSFALLPGLTRSLSLFLKMVYEYHAGIYDVCWNCGEINSIDREEKETVSGRPKYHYTCRKCGEFWVKNHCSNANCHNKLIKHIDNYHTPDEKNTWMVVCPKCLNKPIARERRQDSPLEANESDEYLLINDFYEKNLFTM